MSMPRLAKSSIHSTNSTLPRTPSSSSGATTDSISGNSASGQSTLTTKPLLASPLSSPLPESPSPVPQPIIPLKQLISSPPSRRWPAYQYQAVPNPSMGSTFSLFSRTPPYDFATTPTTAFPGKVNSDAPSAPIATASSTGARSASPTQNPSSNSTTIHKARSKPRISRGVNPQFSRSYDRFSRAIPGQFATGDHDAPGDEIRKVQIYRLKFSRKNDPSPWALLEKRKTTRVVLTPTTFADTASTDKVSQSVRFRETCASHSTPW